MLDNAAASVLHAAHFAAERHIHQRRKDSAATPYINHPIRVMHTLLDAGVRDADVLCAALLHDTIEDTRTSAQEVRALFGERVARLVLECTDDKQLDKVQRKRLQILHAADISAEAALVKLADKYDNCASLSSDPPAHWSREEIAGYLVWSYAVCRVLGDRCTNSDAGLTLYAKVMDLFAQHDLCAAKLDADQLGRRLERYYACIHHSE